MNKKLAMFPMTREQCATARYSDLMSGYSLSYCLVPDFRHIEGADISQIDGGDFVDINVYSYSTGKLQACDVIFLDYDTRLPEIDLYKSVLDDAAKFGVEVVLSRALEAEMGMSSDVASTTVERVFNTLYEIDCPVVTVLTQGERTDQFAVELALRKYFTEAGYSVSQLSSYKAGIFFDIPNVPDFIREPGDTFDKIVGFNHYVKDLTDREQPELMIIGVPDAILKYNDRVLQGLGIIPYIICTAVESDAPVFCMHHASYNQEYFDNMSLHFLHKYGSEATIFNIANCGIVPDAGMEGEELDYFDIPSDFVLHSINDMEHEGYEIFNVLNSKSAIALAMAVETALAGNVRSIR